MSLCTQMEQYWDEVGRMEGYEEFEKEGWSFKVSDGVNKELEMMMMLYI